MKILFLISLQLCYILSLIPVLKIIITDNLNKLNFFHLMYDTSGIFLDFYNDSEFSFIPYEIYKIIFSKYVTDVYPCEGKKIVINENEYESFWCYPGGMGFFRNWYLITEKYAIKIDSSKLFILKNDNYYFRFVSSRNVENIVIDKKLSDLMEVEILDNDDFIINNVDYIHQFDDVIKIN